MTEAELLAEVKQMVSELRLRGFHIRDSRRSWGNGFPDVMIAGPRGIIFAELKNASNGLSPDQRAWGSVLRKSGQRWTVWRPRDLADGTIRAWLESIAEPAGTV